MAKVVCTVVDSRRSSHTTMYVHDPDSCSNVEDRPNGVMPLALDLPAELDADLARLAAPGERDQRCAQRSLGISQPRDGSRK